MLALVIAVCLPADTAFCASAIDVEVAGGAEEVTNWVVEQSLDVPAAARLLGSPEGASAKGISVVEVDEQGELLGVKSSQVDKEDESESVVVSWLVDGKLSPGEVRRFRIELDGRRDMPQPAQAIEANVDEAKCVIRNAPWTLTHDADMGGFISELAIDGEKGKVLAPLTWGDKIHDGTSYRLGNHKALQTRLLSRGPLRVVYELKGSYGAEGNRPAARPEAVYRWTSFAGIPVTRVDARCTQGYGKPVLSHHIIEILFDEAITHGISDTHSQPGDLTKSYWGQEWSAVFGPDVLIGVLRVRNNGVHGGRAITGGYGSYIRGHIGRWDSNEEQCRAYIFWGRGEADLTEVTRWNRILAGPPRTTARLAPLEEEIAALEKELSALDGEAPGPSQEAQTARRVARLVSGMKLAFARREMQAGRFAEAEKACADARAALTTSPSQAEVRKEGSVVAGIVNGHAFLENDEATFVWADKQEGAGFLSIQDRRTGREFLEADLTGAPFWRIEFRRPQGGISPLESQGAPCAVSTAIDAERKEGVVTFDWSHRTADVTVTARLREGESLARLRLEVKAVRAGHGLTRVLFPEVAGITALTPAAAGDWVLDTAGVGGMGQAVASPLRSGVKMQVNYPGMGMQFTAVYGGGQGLYFAEEDPDACSKEIALVPDTAGDTLGFHIAHRVLNYGAPELQKEYRSPGDAVIGPFRGDWYDACRIYRRWATQSAPWCKGGPSATNEDFPKWLADASYWTIDAANNEFNIDFSLQVHKFFEVPGHVMHLYGWWSVREQDDNCGEYLPPRLGPENFVATVRRYHEAGMRVVPYLNGFSWDIDTESYKTKDALRNGALLDLDGRENLTSYAENKQACMCPGSKLWRETLLEISRELVERYDVDGIYFDFLNPHNVECFAPQHGHALGGGNYWSKSVQGLYRTIRTECKALKPDFMMTGENIGEPYIGLLDTFYNTQMQTNAPSFMAVYHDYALVFAYQSTDKDSVNISVGRTFILGKQNMGCEFSMVTDPAYRRQADYYKMLLKCHDRFARPYLSYGEMLRMPKISGDWRMIRGARAGGVDLGILAAAKALAEGYELPAIEGTAWRAPDGRVGVFFVNYDDQPHEFSWELDLSEGAGWDEATALRMSQWTLEGQRPIGDVKGGVLRRNEKLDGWGLLALELEVTE